MRNLVSLPRYCGTKLGKLVKAIAVDDINTWKKLQKATNFTDKELNYHLALLFNDKILSKKNTRAPRRKLDK